MRQQRTGGTPASLARLNPIYIVLLMVLLLFSGVTFAQAKDRYPFPNTKMHQQFYGLISELRCVVCQNESLAASNASIAVQLRQQVYQMVLNGKSNAAIKQFLVLRYGDFVLFKPPFMPSTYVLWLGPFVLLLLGLLGFAAVVIYRQRQRKRA